MATRGSGTRTGAGGDAAVAPPRGKSRADPQPAPPPAPDTMFADMLAPGGTLDYAAIIAVADMLPVMVAFLDPGERFRFVNQPLADWLDRQKSDMMGRTLREVLGDRTYAERKPFLDAAMRGERQFYASSYEHPTRGPLAVQTDYVPWIAPDGCVQGVIALSTDVTEQRAAERALRESEARFRRIADSAPVMMWVTRLDGKRDFVNQAYAEFVGLSPEEAARYDWRQAIHPEDYEGLIAASLAGEASSKPFTLEARYLRSDGEYRWLRSVSQPRFGPEGGLAGFIGVARDVTLEKEAELELRRQVEERTRALAESESRFRAIFDTVLEVLVLLDPDGTVLEVNQKSASWRHPDRKAVIGHKMWESPTMAAYPQHVPLIKKAVATAAKGQIFNAELTMERDGSPTAYLDISMQPVRDDSGQIHYLLFEARDITDLKAAQEQLRQSQKMEALGQLTGGIAHDFNNLLTVVVGGLDIIAKHMSEPKLKRYADNALAAAERGARLTGQLLAFSRVQRLEVRPTQVAPLIDNMRPLLRNVLGPGIEKNFELDEELVPVMADPTQLEVAVLNLVINARDAMPKGGVLTLTTKAVRIDGDPELESGDYVELCIGDTGAGMTPEVASRAFEPFFTTKEVGKGTGLGLSMVYGMARQSGGTARIESAPGEGTAVKLYFRAAEQPAAEAAEEAEEQGLAERGPASVLVIDDDPDVRRFIAESLEEQGYRVAQAGDGREGLKIAEKQKPDLIVIDFIMPGMSGADVAHRILDTKPDQSILFVSGYSETEAVRRVAPDAPLLAKPFRADALERAVRGALARAP